MNENNIKIICALPVLGQPRNSKRIKMLMKAGFQVDAVSFVRKYHKGRLPDCHVDILGQIEHGRFIVRFFKMLKMLPKLRKKVKKYDIIYSFGIDMAILCRLSSLGLKKKIVIEIGDIRSIQVEKSFKGKVVRFLDKLIIKVSKLLVVTSPKYAEEYYNKWLEVYPKVLVLENKLEQAISLVPKTNESLATDLDRLTIGYFGLLRCKKTISILHALATNYLDTVQIFLAGFPMDRDKDFDDFLALKNVEYFGEYKSPQDLDRIYSKVDVVWAVYPFPTNHDQNWKWARTNRFYESCFFKKPMIVLENSADGNIVSKLEIGMTIEQSDDKETAKLIWETTKKKWGYWHKNISKLPEHIYLYTNEGELLKKAILEVVHAG